MFAGPMRAHQIQYPVGTRQIKAIAYLLTEMHWGMAEQKAVKKFSC